MYHTFISDGKLYIRGDDGAIKEITSKFAQQKFEETQRAKDLQSWKSDNLGNNPFFNQGVIWAGQSDNRAVRNFRFLSVITGDSDSLFYLITNDNVTGLFKYIISQNEELRLFHRREFHNLGIDYSAKACQFVAARIMDDGSCDLELMDKDGSSITYITEGDSRDSYPSFSRSSEKEIFYQSAGIARDEQGFPVLYGPESIYKINTETKKLTEIIANDHFDYLLPQDDSEGNLYCIRRPYKQPGHTTFLNQILSVITFPVRFVVAIVRFLETFTRLFSENPYKPAGPQVRQLIENKYIRVLGETINLAKIQKRAGFNTEPSLVPKSWELIKISKNGDIQLIAQHVSSFDIDNNNQIHITNGFRISKVYDKQTNLICKYKIIENLQVG